MITRRLSFETAASLLPLIQEFMSESQWGWTYNEKRALQTIFNYTNSEETIIIVSIADEGQISGFAMLAYDVDFQDEKVGYISKFYISKKFRGTQAARSLRDACKAWFDYEGCIHSFVTKTAAIDSKQDAAFLNLMSKGGWAPCGETLVRPRNE